MLNLNPLQEKLLEILGWFHNFCVENGLRYYAIGGTMLGAMRHQGFIPWDDDVDVAMPRHDYEQLWQIFKDPLGKYMLETPYSEAKDYLYDITKLYDTSTTMTEVARIKIKRGVYLDIFPLDGIGDSYEESLRNYKPIDRLHMFLATRICKIRRERKFYKNMAIIISRMIPSFLVDEKKLLRKLDRMCAARDFDSCRYVTSCMSTYRKREIIEKRVFGNPTEYRFENITVLGPECWNEYLTNLFGDWRQLPPEDKRHSAHDLVDLKLDTSYLN